MVRCITIPLIAMGSMRSVGFRFPPNGGRAARELNSPSFYGPNPKLARVSEFFRLSKWRR